MPADEIRFVEETHQYYVNGVEYPSVSTVLAPFMDFSRIPRDVLERKRQIGRATHKAIELDEAGELDLDTVDPQVEPYFHSWLLFKAVKPLRVFAAERIVYSKKHRYAGRLDLVVEFLDDPGVLWVLDAKAVHTISPATALQVAAYREAWNENEPVKINKRAGLQLKKDGSMAEIFPYDRIRNKHDLNVFLNALNIQNWKVNNGC